MLLNDRALHALEFAKQYAERRRPGKGQFTESPFVLPPGKNGEYVKQTSDLHHQWRLSSKVWGSNTAPRITAATPMRQYA